MSKFLKKLTLTIPGEISFALLVLSAYLILGMYFTNRLGVVGGSGVLDLVVIIFGVWWLSPRFCSMSFTMQKDVTKLSRKQIIELLSLIAILFVIISILGQVFGSFIFSQIKDPNFENYRATENSSAVLYFIFGLIIAPIAEEFLFRGVLFNVFRVKMPVMLAWVLQAAIFSISHGTFVHLPGTFLLGLFTCLVYNLTGKLGSNIGIHMGYNLVAFFADKIMVPNWILNWWFLSIFYILIVVILAVFFAEINKFPNIKISLIKK